MQSTQPRRQRNRVQIRVWFAARGQRTAYAAIGLSLIATIALVVVAGFLLHRSAATERQTLRLERLGTALTRLEDFTTDAEVAHGVTAALATERAAAVRDAESAFTTVQRYGSTEAIAIHPTYASYLAQSDELFTALAARKGASSVADHRRLEQALGAAQVRISLEISKKSDTLRRINPEARAVLTSALVAVLSLITALAWQFELQRRAGRIDRVLAERAQELIRLRDEFVASVSHELRTPLTSILGYLDLLGEDNLPAGERSAALAVVERNAERLLHLVSDLLLVAEADNGRLPLNLIDVDLTALAHQCIEAVKPAAAAGGVTLVLHAEPGVLVRGDTVRLAQLLDNLTSNAVKFTPRDGRVTLDLRMAAGEAVVAVSDTGPGISPADQKRLFDRFFRTASATAGVTPGTGLGLTIAKAIVEAHHGTIEVESVVGSGSTFRATLPVDAA